jgi:hypothetical protein
MGFLSDLVGSFTGAAARKELQAGKTQADAALASGYGDARADYTNAMQSYDPYVQSGQQANTFYNNALGLNGDAARTAATNTLASNPIFSGELGADYMATQRAGNAAGWGAGKEALAGQRVYQQNAGSFLDRYRDQGQQGLQATGAKSNALMARGDLAYGYGATRAGNEINSANALAENRGTFARNVSGALGLGVNALNAWRQPSKIG